MDSEKPPSLRGLLTRVVCTLVGVLLLYVVSVGPACYLSSKSVVDNHLLVDLYSPLVWATEGTPLRAALVAYADFWLRLAGETPHKP